MVTGLVDTLLQLKNVCGTFNTIRKKQRGFLNWHSLNTVEREKCIFVFVNEEVREHIKKKNVYYYLKCPLEGSLRHIFDLARFELRLNFSFFLIDVRYYMATKLREAAKN